MKKTKAYSLEEDVIEVIEKYKKRYNLSSASSALERIILVELPKRADFEEIKQLIKGLNTEYNYKTSTDGHNNEEERLLKIKNSSLGDSFKNSIASMPD